MARARFLASSVADRSGSNKSRHRFPEKANRTRVVRNAFALLLGEQAEVDVFNVGEQLATGARSDKALTELVAQRYFRTLQFESLSPFALTPRIRRSVSCAVSISLNDNGVFDPALGMFHSHHCRCMGTVMEHTNADQNRHMIDQQCKCKRGKFCEEKSAFIVMADEMRYVVLRGEVARSLEISRSRIAKFFSNRRRRRRFFVQYRKYRAQQKWRRRRSNIPGMVVSGADVHQCPLLSALPYGALLAAAMSALSGVKIRREAYYLLSPPTAANNC